MIRFFFIIIYVILAVIAFPLDIGYSDSSFKAYAKENDENYIDSLDVNDDKILNLVNSIEFDVPNEYRADIISTLQLFSYENFGSLTRIKYKPDSLRRGLASDRSIYLNFDKIESKLELKKVLIHEIGHVFDLGHLVSEEKTINSNFKDGSSMIYADDISLMFYSLCWKNEFEQNGECEEKDFASGYSESDPFEDFAETFLLYIVHNGSFVKMMKESDIMQKKYLLMRKYLKTTPKTGEYKYQRENERVWDLTIVE